jgi:urea transporter
MTTQENKEFNPEDIGIKLAQKLAWDGKKVFLVMLSALEDSNYHKVSRELIRVWESVEGPIHE